MHKYANMIIKNLIKPNIFGLRDHRIEIFYEENRLIGFSAAEYPMPGRGHMPCPARYFSEYGSYIFFDINNLDILHILNKIYEENIKNN